MLLYKWPLLVLIFLVANFVSASPNRLLQRGARICKVHLVKKALQNGAHIDDCSTTDEWGRAALHVAVINDCYEVVFYLLTETNAHINIFDDFERTPIYYAARKKNQRLFWLLLRAGADPTIADVDGLTPIDYAENIQQRRKIF